MDEQSKSVISDIADYLNNGLSAEETAASLPAGKVDPVVLVRCIMKMLMEQRERFLVLTIKDGVPDELLVQTSDRKNAERHFLDACSTRISNFDEYNHHDIEAVLSEGYAEYGTGCVCMLDLSNTREV